MASTIRGSDNFDSASLLGVGQTWQNVAASRALSTNYTNDTGKPIIVSVRMTYSSSPTGTTDTCTITVGGVAAASAYNVRGYSLAPSAEAVVPVGAVYSVACSIGSFVSWVELR